MLSRVLPQQVEEVRFSDGHIDGRYRHTMSTPPPSITRTWDSTKPERLVRHDNVLLMTFTSGKLARLLQDTLEP